jgi:hypothetical protein
LINQHKYVVRNNNSLNTKFCKVLEFL